MKPISKKLSDRIKEDTERCASECNVSRRRAAASLRFLGEFQAINTTAGRWVRVKKMDLVDDTLYIVRRVGFDGKLATPVLARWKHHGWRREYGTIGFGNDLMIWVPAAEAGGKKGE